MEFRLIYSGKLKSNGNIKHKNEIRKYFHEQLKVLWDQVPLSKKTYLLDSTHKRSIIKKIKGINFAPLVSSKISTLASLNITLLRPAPPGCMVNHGGDIDNRLKTLLDSLRMPINEKEITENISIINENPFFCLLEDDALITNLSITTDRLLTSSDPSETLIIINVNIRGEILVFDDVLTYA